MAEIEGLGRFEARLRKGIPDAVRRKARSALAVWADKTVQKMEENVPQDTGELFSSIGWVYGDESIPNGATALTSGGDVDNPELSVVIFAGSKDAYHARFVEFGTVKMPEQPFFFPSYRQTRRAGRIRLSKAIKEGLREASR